MIRLELVSAGGETRIVEHDSLPLSVGRDPSCDIPLDDEKASRLHCRIDGATAGEKAGVFIEDLGSSNGTNLNGRRVSREELGRGDRIGVGRFELRVLELRVLAAEPAAAPGEDLPADGAGPVAPPRERHVTGLRRRKIVSGAAPVLVFLLVLGGAYVWLQKQHRLQEEAANAPRQVDSRLAEARSLFVQLQEDVLKRARLDVDLVYRARSLAETYKDVDHEGEKRPFAEFHSFLEERLKLQTGNHLADLVQRRDELIAQRRFGDAIRLVREEGERIETEAPRRDGVTESLVRAVDSAASVGLGGLDSEARYLEHMELPDEARAVYADALASFVGTTAHGRIPALQQALESRLAEAAERRAREERGKNERLVALRAEYSRTKPSSRRAERPRSPAEKLVDLLRAKLGKDRELAGGRKPTAVELVALAAEHLDGEALLLAARVGFAAGLAKESNALLVAYHGRRLADGSSARAEAARVLAESRGLESVPAGGFVYTRKHGWETVVIRAQRLAVAGVEKIASKIASARNVDKLMKRFEEALAVVRTPELDGKSRGVVRERIVAALTKLREASAKKLTGSLKASAFKSLRAARVELDRRRKEAIRIIYDTKIYLPESHPDWKKGDKVNGQQEVDEAVGTVRELWNNAASFAVRFDPRASSLSELVRAIDERCFTELRHRRKGPEDGGDDLLAELRSNLDKRIDLKTYAMGRQDVLAYQYNRRVEKYNQEELDSEDVSQSDKAHARVLNDYREMMGHRRLFLDIRLCRATRKHSAACDREGRIWHSGPDGSPGSRARAEGFGGGVAENVAMGYGNPGDIWWKGWYRASDHHRNALVAHHNCLGYGYVGRVGTQNLSSIGTPFQ